VFSGSRIPPPPEGSTYQIWLATSGEPVSAGVFVPDASGRITIATDSPPTVPRPVIDVRVTIEPDGGRQAPSGETLLARAARRPAAP
jgi:anti-sigma-K factor RskA